jgi:hypothetical protein
MDSELPNPVPANPVPTTPAEPIKPAETYQIFFRGEAVNNPSPFLYRWSVESQLLELIIKDPEIQDRLNRLEKLVQSKIKITSSKTQKEFVPQVVLTKDWYGSRDVRGPRFGVEFPGLDFNA